MQGAKSATYPWKEINSNIWFLTINDVFTWGTYFVVTVLLGLYVSGKLGADATQIVGIGSGIMFLTRGVIQIPLGRVVDWLKSDVDEAIMLMFGNILMGLPVILTTLISSDWHFYVLQIIFGIGGSMNLVSWRKLFAKSLDKGKEGLEYAIYETVMSLSIAAFAIFGGIVASFSTFYFDLVIAVLGMIMLAGNVWAYMIYLKILRRG